MNRGSVCNLSRVSSGGRPCNCCCSASRLFCSASRLLQRIVKLLLYTLNVPICQLAIVSRSVMMLKGGSSGQPSEVDDVQIPALLKYHNNEKQFVCHIQSSILTSQSWAFKTKRNLLILSSTVRIMDFLIKK